MGKPASCLNHLESTAPFSSLLAIPHSSNVLSSSPSSLLHLLSFFPPPSLCACVPGISSTSGKEQRGRSLCCCWHISYPVSLLCVRLLDVKMSKIDTYGGYREPIVASHELRSQKSQDGDNYELARLGKKPVLRVSQSPPRISLSREYPIERVRFCIMMSITTYCHHIYLRDVSTDVSEDMSQMSSPTAISGAFDIETIGLTAHVYRETLASCR